MIHAADFQLLRVQASAFFSGIGFRPATLLSEMPEAWRGVYDGDPISVPLPDEAPAVLPSVVLRSRDDTQRVQVSRARVDLIMSCENAPQLGLPETLGELAGRLAALLRTNGVTFGRLAAIVARVAEVEQPGIELSRQFCSDRWLQARGPLNRPEGFELHAHKVFDLLKDIPVNSWVRIKTAKLGPEPYRHVLVEQDINSLGEEIETRCFDRDALIRWFQAANEQLDRILELYFPDDEHGNGE